MDDACGVYLYWISMWLLDKIFSWREKKMTFIPNPTKVKLELKSNEIEAIIDELERAPYNLYKFLNYDKLIKKLKETLE